MAEFNTVGLNKKELDLKDQNNVITDILVGNKNTKSLINQNKL